MKKRILAIALCMSIALGCTACGTTAKVESSTSSDVEKEASAAEDIGDGKNEAASKDEINATIEKREYTYDECKTGILDEYVPQYLVDLDLSTFDKSKAPKQAAIELYDSDEPLYLPLPIKFPDILSMEGIASQEDENEVIITYNGQKTYTPVKYLDENESLVEILSPQRDPFDIADPNNEATSFSEVINKYGTPSGYECCNFGVGIDGLKSKDSARAKASAIFYEYDDFVIEFDFVDVHFYSGVKDSDYFPDTLAYVYYYSKEYFDANGTSVSKSAQESPDYYSLLYSTR